MALLPSIKRVNTTDFTEKDQDLVGKLGGLVNDNTQPLYDSLNKKLTFDDNFLGSIKDVQVTVNSTGVPINPTIIITGVSQPKGTIVLSATNLSDSTQFPTGAPFISFAVVNNGIQITHVSGIAANYTYSLRVLTLG